jgi:hypothetical protein
LNRLGGTRMRYSRHGGEKGNGDGTNSHGPMGGWKGAASSIILRRAAAQIGIENSLSAWI